MYDDFATDEYGSFSHDEGNNDNKTAKSANADNSIPVVIADQLAEHAIHSIPCKIKYTGLSFSL